MNIFKQRSIKRLKDCILQNDLAGVEQWITKYKDTNVGSHRIVKRKLEHMIYEQLPPLFYAVFYSLKHNSTQILDVVLRNHSNPQRQICIKHIYTGYNKDQYSALEYLLFQSECYLLTPSLGLTETYKMLRGYCLATQDMRHYFQTQKFKNSQRSNYSTVSKKQLQQMEAFEVIRAEQKILSDQLRDLGRDAPRRRI